jgi:ubiquitin C-terminal hydrolase
MSSTVGAKHGLANIGNTCYLNSAFQSLRHSSKFAAYFGSNEWEKHKHADRKGAALAEETAKLVTLLNTEGTNTIVPMNFVRAFVTYAHDVNDQIRMGAQADAAEAIQILLDGLHTQLCREVRMDITGRSTTPDQFEMVKALESWATFFRKEFSPIVDSFYGQTQTRVTCQGCKGKSTRYEPWSLMKVPIPGAEKAGAPAPTLQDCIRAGYASETLEEYSCDNCKKRGPALIEHAISRFPSQIILSLKRFTNAGAKVHARIPYNEDLVDLAEWRAWPSIHGSATSRYRVVSTIEHLGSSRGGHYCMRTRSPSDSKWIVYDDGSLSVSRVGGEAGPDTYILFLEKCA